MVYDKQITSEEASALRKEAAVASIERDVAVYTAVRASGREAVAIEDAREQQAETLHAQSFAIRASEREAVARDDAREQHVETLSAQAETANMNTLRHLANVRADSEARGGDRARFILYLLTGTILVVLAAWLFTR